MPKHLEGLVAAPFTPMAADGGVALDVIDRYAELLARNGAIGAFVCGSTGEGLSLSVDERMAVARRWRQAAPADLRVIVHVGHTALPDARALADHARRIGAYAVAAVPPIYYRPASVADLAAYLAEVSAAAPELPFYYYHIPALTGVWFAASEVLSAGAESVPSLAGAKFTHEDLAEYARCVALMEGRFDVLYGRDEMLLGALSLGARGAVGTTYNFAAPLYLRMIRAFRAGDLDAARRDQHRAVALVEVFRRFGGIPAGKAIMKLIGLDCGPVRSPLRSLGEGQLAGLRRELEAAGFFEDCCRLP
jgi:N-acetylneuraminate lyase